MVGAEMPVSIAVYVDVSNSGLPLWQVVPLTVLGCAIGYGVILGIIALFSLPGQRRLRARVHAVEAAAGDSPVFGRSVVYPEATRLFGEVQAGWDARDRERLARISDPELMSDWAKRLDGYAEAGQRYRVEVLKGPRLDYVGLLADRGRVRLRVRAKLRRGLEAKGKRRGLPQDKGAQKIDFEEYWTLSRSDGAWILWSTRPARYRAEYSTEPIVTETPAHAV
jgi:predicted lipid-binding transport protein (Tim44 family)